MPTQNTNNNKSPTENEPMRKLSLVSEDQSSPANSQPEVQASGRPSPEQLAEMEKLMNQELTPEEQKHFKKMMRKMEKQGIQIPPGFAKNPLLKLEPNRTCPCLSGKKFKVCCRDKLALIVPENVAKDFEVQMSKPDLVFMTPDNEAKIQKHIAPHVKAELEKQEKIANEKAAFEKRKIDEALKNRR